ncbi:hypothetical protein Fmac_018658 [Flemingia macrophylla]|uniref:Pentatricopeptide repeat-containing protein n=1 Tax=Flemingia macrophylla TaxID=520843 RepID=A0ABD1M5L1_9FABA
MNTACIHVLLPNTTPKLWIGQKGLEDVGNIRVGKDVHKVIKPSRLVELKQVFPKEKFLLEFGGNCINMVLEQDANGEDALRGVHVCFSALVVALAHNFFSPQALSTFSDMRHLAFSSIVHIVSEGLRAVVHLAVLEQCRIIHAHTVVSGLGSNVGVASALVDVYGKTSVVDDARRVFKDNFSHMNVVGWNAMMVAYAQQGDCQSAFELFGSLQGCAFFA